MILTNTTKRHSVSIGLIFILTSVVLELSATTLPSPLNLTQALRIAELGNPNTQIAQAKVNFAEALVSEAEAKDGFDTFLELHPTLAKQSTSGDVRNDGSVFLGARHLLYDFGANSAKRNQFQYDVAAQKQLQRLTHIQHQIATAEAYYQVILSDLRYAADNEDMTVWFLRYDKLRERHDLGRVSDVELARAEHLYRRKLNQRKITETQQRISRQKLALLLNQLDDIPSDLIMPATLYADEKIPDARQFYQLCLPKNPLILAMTDVTQAKRSALEAETKGVYPVITAEMNLIDYQIERNSRNSVELGVKLHLPLYQSGRTQAKTAQAKSTLQISAAQLQLAEQQLQQEILELVLQLQALQVEKNSVNQELDFRDINVDKRRAEYELEIQTNMGNAMAGLTRVQWREKKIDFDIELTWMKLHALRGEAPVNRLEETGQ